MRSISPVWIAIVAAAQLLAASSVAAPTAEDEKAARNVLNEYVATWNRHDMKSFAQLVSPDCDYIVWTGKQLKGREEVFSYHDELHRGKFKDRQLSAVWKDFRFVNDHVAVGHVSFSGSGPSSDGRGKTAALATFVLTKKDGTWLIDAFHNTLLSSEGNIQAPANR